MWCCCGPFVCAPYLFDFQMPSFFHMFWSDRFIACAPFVPSGALSLLQFFGRNTKGQGRVNVDDFRFLARWSQLLLALGAGVGCRSLYCVMFVFSCSLCCCGCPCSCDPLLCASVESTLVYIGDLSPRRHRTARSSCQEVSTTTIHRPCLLYTSPSPRDRQKSRMPSSA